MEEEKKTRRRTFFHFRFFVELQPGLSQGVPELRQGQTGPLGVVRGLRRRCCGGRGVGAGVIAGAAPLLRLGGEGSGRDGGRGRCCERKVGGQKKRQPAAKSGANL